MMNPSETVKRNGKQVANTRHVVGKPVIVHRMKYYGDPERLRWAMDFQERKRKLKVPDVDIYGLTVREMCKRFGIAESTAAKEMGGLRAYRQAKFLAELETNTGRLYDDLQRIAQKAEADKQYQAAVAAHREIAKITGAYAPLRVDADITVHQGPSVQDQLRAVLGVLSKEGRAGLELALAEIERAKAEGRLQLPSGDGDEAPDQPADDVEDAELVNESENK